MTTDYQYERNEMIKKHESRMKEIDEESERRSKYIKETLDILDSIHSQIKDLLAPCNRCGSCFTCLSISRLADF